MGFDTWNEAPSAIEGSSREPTVAPVESEEGQAAGDDSFTGVFSANNVSKHDGGGFGGPADGGCRICGDEAHFARDCPYKKPNSGECYNCGEMGHNKADCNNPSVERPFDGNCNICTEVGHRAADCPLKGPSLCKICKAEDHRASECSANRLLARLTIQDVSADDAWEALQKADSEKDVDDIKEAILNYAMVSSSVTFVNLEEAFREAEMNTYLIAKQQETSDTHTIVNLQGTIDQSYVVSIQFSAKPRRAKSQGSWPETPQENIARLAEAGWPMDRMVPKCSNCEELGHSAKQCPQEKLERKKTVITCANCNEEGHYARDCTQERKKLGKECRNCGEAGHMVKDCPTKAPDLCHNCGQEGHRSAECQNERVTKCRNCDKYGHSSKECSEPEDMSKVQCRDCDEFGHRSRQCDKKTDWSRVECSNCHGKGHSYKRCTNPAGGPPNDPVENGCVAAGGWEGGDNGVSWGGAATSDSWGGFATGDSSW